jgi:hypothetical protein
VLEAEFAAAVDGGIPYGEYVYGRLETGHGADAYAATPAVYGSAARETVVLDASGRLWSKDLAGQPLPAVWPSSDPAAEGWKR